MSIVSTISNHPNSSELDLSMYINEIASHIYVELLDVIEDKLLSFEDTDAIEDLRESLEKINRLR